MVLYSQISRFAVLLVLLPAVGILQSEVVQANMPDLKIVDQTEFTVVGIEVRTTNAREMSGNGVIGPHWAKFFQDGILQKIPNKVDTNIYAVYTDYASDRNGEFSHIIGARVTRIGELPPGMVAKTVPKGRYAIVTSAEGPVGNVVSGAWQKIWTLEDSHQLGGTRAYKADFELYDQRSLNPQDSQVDIYLGIKQH